jgi:hypothetical protein
MERTTKSQLRSMVTHLNKVLNRPTEMFDANRKFNPGHLYLDKIDSGWRLEEISPNGGSKTPVGSYRYTAGEMWRVLYILREVLEFGSLKPFPKADTNQSEAAS